MTSTDEAALVAATTAKLLEEIAPAGIPAALEELGWFELWTDDPAAAAHALFGRQGRLARTSPMLSLLMGGAVARHLGRATALDVPLLLPSPGAGLLVQLDALAGRRSAFAFARIADADVVVELPVEALVPAPVRGADPELGLAVLESNEAVRHATVVAEHAAAARIGADVLALGRRLLAEELTAIALRELEITLEHATARTQFGRQIGSYQAVQHKLADVHVAAAVSVLAVERAWAQPDEPGLSRMAKVLAGDAVELANRHCQQVLGGIGFTWEHPFHHYLRRGLVLAELLGSSRRLATEAGAELLATTSLPSTFAL